MKKITISTILAAVLMTTQSFALFGYDIVYDPVQTGKAIIEYGKQAKRWGKTIEHYRKEVESMKNQFLSYKMMLQNIGKLPETQWNEFQKQFIELGKIVDFGESINYSSASYDTKFNQLFKGYDKYLADAAGKTTSQNAVDFQTQYKKLSTSTRDTVNGALKSLGLQAKDLENDEATMKQLQALSSSAVGQKAAIQAANEIALHQTHTLKKLQQTIMTQANMQGEYIAKQNEEKTLKKAATDAYTKPIQVNTGDDKPLKLPF